MCLSCNFNAFPYQGCDWRTEALSSVCVCVCVCVSVRGSLRSALLRPPATCPVHTQEGLISASVTPLPVKRNVYVCLTE